MHVAVRVEDGSREEEREAGRGGRLRERPSLFPPQVAENQDERRERQREEHEPFREPPEDDLPDAEERRVDEDDAEEPVEERERAAGDLLHAETEPARDARPARASGAHARVERLELLVGLGARRERGRQPDGRRDGDGDQHDERLDAQLLAREARVGGRVGVADQREGGQGDGGGGDHRRDLAPRVDPPPVPAKDQDEARPAAEREEEAPRPLDRRQLRRHDDREEEEADRREARDVHVVPLGGALLEEAAVDVVHEVARAPV